MSGAQFNLSPSSTLKIQIGDITRWFIDGSSDAIVNPTNERMFGDGGADGAIHRAAGPELRTACYEVPEVRPGIRCPTGEARITRGFKLPASHVIHAVGPDYDDNSNVSALLSDAYRNSLRVARENDINYVSFPAISCGTFGYPLDEAAIVAISTIKEHCIDIKEVHFVLFADDIYNVWVKKAKELLPNLTQQHHQQTRGLHTLTLPDLPYDYGSLEPAISGEIMQIHHQKHHQAYVTNYNKAIKQLHTAIANGDASSAVKLQNVVTFNGGGHVNHSIFWKNLAPIKEGGGQPPHGSLSWAINNSFGSLEKLIAKMNAEGAAVQGSGWVWLALDKEFKRLVVETTSNEDPLVTKDPNLVPLIGIDVWEHAYYLQYKNVRPDYLKNIWKVINWKYASDLYEMECP